MINSRNYTNDQKSCQLSEEKFQRTSLSSNSRANKTRRDNEQDQEEVQREVKTQNGKIISKNISNNQGPNGKQQNNAIANIMRETKQSPARTIDPKSRNSKLKISQSEVVKKPSFLKHNQKLFQEALDKLKRIEAKSLIQTNPDEIMKHVDDVQLFEMLQKSILQTQDAQKSNENLIPLFTLFDQRAQSIAPGQLPLEPCLNNSKHSESLFERKDRNSTSPISNRKIELIKKITATQKHNQLVQQQLHQESSKISSNSNRSFNKSTISSHNTSKNNKGQSRSSERLAHKKFQAIVKRNEGIDQRSKELISKTERILTKAKIADQSRAVTQFDKEKLSNKNKDLMSKFERNDRSEDEADHPFKELLSHQQEFSNRQNLEMDDNLITQQTLEDHFKRMSPIKLKKISGQDDLSILSTGVAKTNFEGFLDNPPEKDSMLNRQGQIGKIRGSRSSREFQFSGNSHHKYIPNASDIQNMAYQMSQRQLQQQNIVQPSPFPERQPGLALSSQNFFQSQQQKPKTSASQTRGTQQPQQIQHKMSQKKLVEEIKQMNRKLDVSPATASLMTQGVNSNFPAPSSNMQLNPINSSNPNITQNDLSNLSQKLHNQISIPSIGRNSQQGIYSNLQMRSAPGIYNNIQSKTQYNNGVFPTNLNSSGYLGFSNERSMLMSSSGYQQYTQNLGMHNGPVNPLTHMQQAQATTNQGAQLVNNTLAYINQKNAINLSSQSLERPTSQQSNMQQRKTHQSFLTPQRQAKLNEIQKAGKKLIIKPNQILKNQQSPSSQQYQIGNQNYPSQIGATTGFGNLSAKDKVMMDKRTYDELMNYLVKVECKRIEKDRIQSNYFLSDKAQTGGASQILSGKRPSSTLKRLVGLNAGERMSNNPRPYGVGATGQYISGKEAFLFNPPNNFNNSSFLSAAPTSLGRNSKLSKTPQKKLAQPSKLKNIMQIQNKQLSSAEDRGIASSSSLRQIKRNNYVNELQSAYNHQTENSNKSTAHTAQALQSQQQQVYQFFNINQSQSIPTSKKGTQKKIELQDTLPHEYQQMTQPKLQQLLNTGKISQNKAGVLNPTSVYMGDRVQSARGGFKGKDFINPQAISNPQHLLDLSLVGQNSEIVQKSSAKASNLLLQKDKPFKQAANANNSKFTVQSRNQDGLSSAHANSELSSKQAMSQRDNSVGSKQISSRQTNQVLSSQDNGYKLNKAQENSLVKRLTSAKVKKENPPAQNERGRSAKPKEYGEIERRLTEGGDDEISNLQIQLDSDLLYGSNLDRQDQGQVIMKDEMPCNEEVYIIDHIDHQNFNTFGDSEKNKVTAVSELQSPDNRMHSPKNIVPQSSLKSSIPHRLENDPYKNQSFNGQEFHYSGSFGVPITLANQSYYVDQNNKIVQSVINQGPNNLSFSLVGQTDMSMISQDQLQSNHQVYIDQKGAIIIEDNDVSFEEGSPSQVQSAPQSSKKKLNLKKLPQEQRVKEFPDNDLNFLDILQDDEKEVQQIIDHPFYLQDYQEEFLDNEQMGLSPNSGRKSELVGIDNQTVEAVKKKLINDPEYRRELLERVLPQFSKLNEQFTNSFLYQLKYANEDSSISSNSVQKSNQSTQRYLGQNNFKNPQGEQPKVNASQQKSLAQINQSSSNNQLSTFSDNLIVQSSSDLEDNGLDLGSDLYTFDQRGGTHTQLEQQNFKDLAAYELLRKINLNFNKANLNTIQSSQRKEDDNRASSQKSNLIPGTSQTSSMQNMGQIFIDSQHRLLLHSDRNNDVDDDDETNTVIENECENDYADIYQSIGEDEVETEELRKKREFEYEKLLLKRQIMMVAGPIKNTEGSSPSRK